MAPPAFSDLGKQARDIFNKNFYGGQWKLEAKSQSESGCKFKSTTVNNNENGSALSTLETEFSWPDYGLKFVEKWNTINDLSAEITIEDQFLKGLKASFDSSFNPSSSKRKGIVKTAYKRDFLSTNLDVDFDYAGPTVKGATVVGYQKWLAGYQVAYDVPKSKLVTNNFCLGYDAGDYAICGSSKGGQDFEGSYYHRFSPSLEMAAVGSFSAGSNVTSLNLAAKYNLSEDTSIKTKVSNNGLVCLSLQQRVLNGASMTLSSSIDAKNFQTGDHKVGLALEFDQ